MTTGNRCARLLPLLLVIPLLGLAGCDGDGDAGARTTSPPLRTGSGPRCVLEENEWFPEVFVVRGEFDYGFVVRTRIRNRGRRGQVRVSVRLASSEGDYVRRRTVFLDAGGARTLSFQFHEPTVNATDIQAWVEWSP